MGNDAQARDRGVGELQTGRTKFSGHDSRANHAVNENLMYYVLIIHEVETYPAWKAVFDAAVDIRRNAGEIDYQLLRFDRDANTVVHFSQWSSLDNARRFFESPELVEIRKTAGVKSPQFIYLQEIERGVL